jgi:hypothetical protein
MAGASSIRLAICEILQRSKKEEINMSEHKKTEEALKDKDLEEVAGGNSANWEKD